MASACAPPPAAAAQCTCRWHSRVHARRRSPQVHASRHSLQVHANCRSPQLRRPNQTTVSDRPRRLLHLQTSHKCDRLPGGRQGQGPPAGAPGLMWRRRTKGHACQTLQYPKRRRGWQRGEQRRVWQWLPLTLPPPRDFLRRGRHPGRPHFGPHCPHPAAKVYALRPPYPGGLAPSPRPKVWGRRVWRRRRVWGWEGGGKLAAAASPCASGLGGNRTALGAGSAVRWSARPTASVPPPAPGRVVAAEGHAKHKRHTGMHVCNMNSNNDTNGQARIDHGVS